METEEANISGFNNEYKTQYLDKYKNCKLYQNNQYNIIDTWLLSITLNGLCVIGEPLTLNNKFLIKIFTRTSRKYLRLNLSLDLWSQSRRIHFNLKH